jgi:hypothetical protein
MVATTCYLQQIRGKAVATYCLVDTPIVGYYLYQNAENGDNTSHNC